MKLVDIEYSRYSQNGEDGIIDFILSNMKKPKHTFVEIGCSNGIENNSSNLALKDYKGVVFDAKHQRIEAYYEFARRNKIANNVAAYARHMTILRTKQAMLIIPTKPDFFSIDIDSIDFYIVETMLRKGFKPSLICVEYNAAFKKKPQTVVYNEKFYLHNYNKLIYFGAGIEAWKILMQVHGYKFITVCSDGINAFFVKSDRFYIRKINELEGKAWADCPEITERTKMSVDERYGYLQDKPLRNIIYNVDKIRYSK